MYKVGDKFIIEIDEVFTGKATGYPQYRIKGFDSLIINDRGLEKLRTLDYAPIFCKGYEAGKQAAIENENLSILHKDIDEAYNKGLSDAWEAAKKIIKPADDDGYNFDVLRKIFGEPIMQHIFKHNTAAEAIAKIKAYEDKQKQDAEIKVGDEVILNANATHENEKVIVLAYNVKVRLYNVLINDGSTAWVKENAIERKTGKHYSQISELLAEMKGR